MSWAVDAIASWHVDLSRPVRKIDGVPVAKNSLVLLASQRDSKANGIYIAERRGLRRRFFLRRSELKSKPNCRWTTFRGTCHRNSTFVHINEDGLFCQFIEIPEDWS